MVRQVACPRFVNWSACWNGGWPRIAEADRRPVISRDAGPGAPGPTASESPSVPTATAAGFDAADEEPDDPQDHCDDQHEPQEMRGEAKPAEDGENQQRTSNATISSSFCAGHLGRSPRGITRW